MPVEFTHGTGLDREQADSKIKCSGEVLGVEKLDAATRDLIRLLFAKVVAVCALLRDDTGRTSDVVGWV